MHRYKSAIVALFFAGMACGAPGSGLADPGGRKLRSVRPIVPIKKRVGGDTKTESRTLRVAIPPPPIPDPEASLFPAESVPEVDHPPEPMAAAADEEEKGTVGSSSTNRPDKPEEEVDESEESDDSDPEEGGIPLARLRQKAHELAELGLPYEFGADEPDDGGMDCSGVIQYMLTELGVEDVPRTSYDQYDWLEQQNRLDDVYGDDDEEKLLENLSPGDLIFWGGTWDSGHQVSHVMLYMGYDPDTDEHYIFGARSKSKKGLLGHGVDVFELDPDRGRLIACGKIPGITY